ncbi:MAG: SusD/RagB family nutrient-binding outer membrane lipoprotein [Candidatus Symbiothrix sp.]|jgi:hypothetical protein|nr:SusD/RagB family nutrient-binding outer membrane lipoprotein [Candidatus Symbiothrix sp.]
MDRINKTGITAIASWIVFLTFSACTAHFEDYNTNPVGVTAKELEQDFNHIGVYFPAVQQMIYCNYQWGEGTDWTFQRMQNLNADIWSGYMASASLFGFEGIDNRTYFLQAGWNDAAWDYTYAHMMPNTLSIEKECRKNPDRYAHFEAINKILKVLGISRICDQYGPVIYTQYGQSKTAGVYDSAQDAYKAFFNDLKEAVAILDEYIKENPGMTPFAKFDMAYAGNYTQWMKLANTLRLRLAMRVVKYDPVRAQTEAEAAMAAPGGVMTSNTENFTISGKGYFHPLAAISSWKDISIGADLESILVGYDDPRIHRMATGVKGMRTGIPDLDSKDYHSLVSCVNSKSADPAVLVTAAEAYFLRAEGALRAWNMGGSAKNLYETGIQTSFAQWGVPIEDYLTSANVPADFTDQLQPEIANTPAVSTITPNWDDATTDEEKLEKIITQKWIAGFPEGQNAWAEWRRTGYPKLFPIIKNDSQGVISSESGVRRLPFSSAEKYGNAEGIADAVEKLGGPDTGATRLFWDIDKTNF